MVDVGNEGKKMFLGATKMFCVHIISDTGYTHYEIIKRQMELLNKAPL